ncbi:MAG: hypothetical protein ABI683_02630 [Ginsengibacter sp.]
MKTLFFKFISISGVIFLSACGDPSTTETSTESKKNITSETSATVKTLDSVKKTTISVGPDGAGVSSKNTEVKVDQSGVKIGTKDIKVDVKSKK